MARLNCEHCNNEIGDNRYSMLVVLQHVNKNAYMYYQCEGGALVDLHNWQHWHCSHQHMLTGVTNCILKHHSEEKLHANIMGTTNLHKIILGSSLPCRWCHKTMIDKAYRFCLTHATPYNYIPDGHMDMFSGWCCSLDHAVSDVLLTLSNLSEVNEHWNGEDIPM